MSSIQNVSFSFYTFQQKGFETFYDINFCHTIQLLLRRTLVRSVLQLNQQSAALKCFKSLLNTKAAKRFENPFAAFVLSTKLYLF